MSLSQIKSKFTFDLGEVVRPTDTVYTKCKLLMYQIYAVQSKGGETKEHSAERNSCHDLAKRSEIQHKPSN